MKKASIWSRFFKSEKKSTSNASSKGHKKVLIAILSSFFGLALVIFIAIPRHRARSGFKTLDSVRLYAKLFPEEKAVMENDNPTKPDYSKYWAGRNRGFFGARIDKIKALLKRPVTPWTPETYKTYIKALTDGRKEKDVYGNPVHRIVGTPNGRLVFWGDLQGAFHSLARGLCELEKLGILGSDLKLKSLDDYLIFTGDCIDRSPFSTETITLICCLMAANPFNTLYVRGNHESNNYWKSYGLKEELQIRAKGLSAESVPLETETNEFFKTLPVAVYFGMPPKVDQTFLRISHESANDQNRVTKIDESKLIKFLSTPVEKKLKNINLDTIKETTQSDAKIKVLAFIKAEIKRDSYQAMEGLRMTTPENGEATWTMLSCPTEAYRKGLSYFFDAFSIINLGSRPEEATIELHCRDMRTTDDWKTKRFYLLTGQDASNAPSSSAPPAVEAQSSKSEKAVMEKEKVSQQPEKKEVPASVEKPSSKEEVNPKNAAPMVPPAEPVKQEMEAKDEPANEPSKAVQAPSKPASVAQPQLAPKEAPNVAESKVAETPAQANTEPQVVLKPIVKELKPLPAVQPITIQTNGPALVTITPLSADPSQAPNLASDTALSQEDATEGSPAQAEQEPAGQELESAEDGAVLSPEFVSLIEQISSSQAETSSSQANNSSQGSEAGSGPYGV